MIVQLLFVSFEQEYSFTFVHHFSLASTRLEHVFMYRALLVMRPPFLMSPNKLNVFPLNVCAALRFVKLAGVPSYSCVKTELFIKMRVGVAIVAGGWIYISRSISSLFDF